MGQPNYNTLGSSHSKKQLQELLKQTRGEEKACFTIGKLSHYVVLISSLGVPLYLFYTLNQEIPEEAHKALSDAYGWLRNALTHQQVANVMTGASVAANGLLNLDTGDAALTDVARLVKKIYRSPEGRVSHSVELATTGVIAVFSGTTYTGSDRNTNPPVVMISFAPLGFTSSRALIEAIVQLFFYDLPFRVSPFSNDRFQSFQINYIRDQIWRAVLKELWCLKEGVKGKIRKKHDQYVITGIGDLLTKLLMLKTEELLTLPSFINEDSKFKTLCIAFWLVMQISSLGYNISTYQDPEISLFVFICAFLADSGLMFLTARSLIKNIMLDGFVPSSFYIFSGKTYPRLKPFVLAFLPWVIGFFSQGGSLVQLFKVFTQVMQNLPKGYLLIGDNSIALTIINKYGLDRLLNRLCRLFVDNHLTQAMAAGQNDKKITTLKLAKIEALWEKLLDQLESLPSQQGLTALMESLTQQGSDLNDNLLWRRLKTRFENSGFNNGDLKELIHECVGITVEDNEDNKENSPDNELSDPLIPTSRTSHASGLSENQIHNLYTLLKEKGLIKTRGPLIRGAVNKVIEYGITLGLPAGVIFGSQAELNELAENGSWWLVPLVISVTFVPVAFQPWQPSKKRIPTLDHSAQKKPEEKEASANPGSARALTTAHCRPCQPLEKWRGVLSRLGNLITVFGVICLVQYFFGENKTSYWDEVLCLFGGALAANTFNPNSPRPSLDL